MPFRANYAVCSIDSCPSVRVPKAFRCRSISSIHRTCLAALLVRGPLASTTAVADVEPDSLFIAVVALCSGQPTCWPQPMLGSFRLAISFALVRCSIAHFSWPLFFLSSIKLLALGRIQTLYKGRSLFAIWEFADINRIVFMFSASVSTSSLLAAHQHTKGRRLFALYRVNVRRWQLIFRNCIVAVPAVLMRNLKLKWASYYAQMAHYDSAQQLFLEWSAKV